MKRDRHRGTWAVFRWPLLLAACSAAGLISALLGDGYWDVFSWLLLGGLPVVIAAIWYGKARIFRCATAIVAGAVSRHRA